MVLGEFVELDSSSELYNTLLYGSGCGMLAQGKETVSICWVTLLGTVQSMVNATGEEFRDCYVRCRLTWFNLFYFWHRSLRFHLLLVREK